MTPPPMQPVGLVWTYGPTGGVRASFVNPVLGALSSEMTVSMN
jgi:hypothetical protein